MGGSTFMVRSTGKNAKEAFRSAVQDALYESGHGGYTGTIAEKDSFVMIDLPSDIDKSDAKVYRSNVYDFCRELIDNSDPRIDDKWGPAGCIDLGDNKYVFFGWASC